MTFADDVMRDVLASTPYFEDDTTAMGAFVVRPPETSSRAIPTSSRFASTRSGQG